MAEQVVYIEGNEVRLVAPKKVGVCTELAVLCARHDIRGKAAALGLCWFAGGSPGYPGGMPDRFKHDLLEYADAVLEELYARGYTLNNVAELGDAAFALVASRVPTGEGVRSAAGFFARAEADSTGA